MPPPPPNPEVNSEFVYQPVSPGIPPPMTPNDGEPGGPTILHPKGVTPTSSEMPSNDSVYHDLGSYRPISEDGEPVPRYIKASPSSYQRIMDVEYNVGDKVHYSKDKIKDRVWTIAAIEGMAYTITTTDTQEIPKGAYVGENTNIITLSVPKIELYRVNPPKQLLENYEEDVQGILGEQAEENEEFAPNEAMGNVSNGENKKKITIKID